MRDDLGTANGPYRVGTQRCNGLSDREEQGDVRMQNLNALSDSSDEDFDLALPGYQRVNLRFLRRRLSRSGSDSSEQQNHRFAQTFRNPTGDFAASFYSVTAAVYSKQGDGKYSYFYIYCLIALIDNQIRHTLCLITVHSYTG
ncbi:unnamed protein product [Protopolystoma xenopodis]|uniref:Uncharacterized protein n=1 Tax=Protopolystoma xenopodis TaxID=117903 RepID=A0A448WTM1_9PLAT|nr:unnamed protein product [Protopolystoma xenopodis]